VHVADTVRAEPGVEVQLRMFGIFLPSLFLSPCVSIDGLMEKTMGWGDQFVSLTPGRHTLTCWLSGWRPDTTDVVIPKAGVLTVRWRGPAWWGLSGKWTVLT
jgi:hypothetical protein